MRESIIGVMALILAVPLSIAANLLTPRIQNWWSTRSQRALKKRIAKLQETAREAETKSLFTDAERSIYLMSLSGIIILVAFINFLWGCLLCIVPLDYETMVKFVGVRYTFRIYAFPFLVYAGLVTNATLFFLLSRRSRRTWYLHTERGRIALQKEVETLQSKLQ